MLICMVCMKKKKKKGAGGWDTGATKPPQDHVVKMPPSGGYGYPSTGSNIDSGQQSGMTGTSLASSPSLTLGFNKSTFTYDELAAATNGFAKEYMLGQGGFGFVHKGVLPNGKEIAVKSLKAGSGQGEREFQAEVEIISRVHHRHLVSLVGYCIAGGQRMLVYEFMPNDTLDFHLHKKGELDFPTRLRIALGGAKGLAYLHEDCHPRIIHRDIKASNILLDENYEAMCRPLLAKSLETGDYHEFVDPRLEGNYDPHLMKRLVACAAAAVRHSAKRRPKMSQIVRALEGDVSLDDLNDGAKVGMLSSSEASSDYDTRAYNEDLKKFRQMAFETKDFASSEYGGTTSEYTSNQSSGLSDNSMEMMH